MDIVQIIEIIAFVLGIPYVVCEVLQKNDMWYFGMVTSTACAIQFFLESNWANMGLNIYYVVMAVWGLYQWKKDSLALNAEDKAAGEDIHLTHLSLKTGLWSLAIFIAGTALLIWLLEVLHDSNPILDALSTSLCVVAMFWLARSIPYHWILWIIGDIILVVMCSMAGKMWLTILYAAYVIASAYGLFRWFKRGKFVA